MATVLIADDTMFMRKLIKVYLQNSEFRVIGEASNGAEAVELYSRLRPEIVTMDITMPKYDGVKATKGILKFDPSAKIIMCSAMGQKAFVQDAVEAGAVDFLINPFTPEDLLSRLKVGSG